MVAMNLGPETSELGNGLAFRGSRAARLAIGGLVFALLATTRPSPGASAVIVGSKKFTESYVLAEIAKRSLEQNGIRAQHRQGMGGTIILWEALRQGFITCYPEYTGTIAKEILKSSEAMSFDQIARRLEQYQIGTTSPLGFNNTYALVMRRDRARSLGIHQINDLRNHPELVIGLTHEFLGRADGWQPLCTHYGLQMPNVKGIDHTLGYLALANRTIDVKDAYSTDAKIEQNDLIVLEDDRKFFPQYDAVFLFRLEANPRVPEILRRIEGTLDQARMTKLNAAAERWKDYSRAASLYFQDTHSDHRPLWMSQVIRNTGRHLQLVLFALSLSVLIGVPLGIWSSRPSAVSLIILGTAGLIQTIPSLALLALLVSLPWFGIGAGTAILALLLYGLLPIIRNTASGLQDIPVPLRESAAALGLGPAAQMCRVFLPLASRSILSGIKTSAIITVGTATLAALIGAGGLGEPIISGLNLNDHATILQGAIPAGMLALLLQFGFELLDRLLIPKGLRLQGNRKALTAENAAQRSRNQM